MRGGAYNGRMSADHSTVVLSMRLSVLLAPGLALASGPSVATKPIRPTLVQSASSGQAKTARQALLKQHTLNISRTTPHPGKIVGTAARPPSKTIVTKRFITK